MKKYRLVKRREASKLKKSVQRRFGPIENINELRAFGFTVELPRSMSEMTPLKMYSVPVKYESYPGTEGILFISQKQVISSASAGS